MTNQTDIEITLVCPTFNSQEFIERTLNSVFSQTLPVREIIVSDDGSTDETLSIVERVFSDYKGETHCKLVRNNHIGPGATRNSGILNSNSTWVAFLDSDDLWEANKIEKVSQVIKAKPNINFICHNEYRINKKMEKSVINCSSRFNPSKSIVNQLYWANIFSTSAVVCKRSLLIERGVFDERLMSIQDYELWLRISPFINAYIIDETLGTYIERKGNITSRNTIGRFINELTVVMRHRRLVSNFMVAARIPRLIMTHLYHVASKFL